jgi:molecular chaperone IbpA
MTDYLFDTKNMNKYLVGFDKVFDTLNHVSSNYVKTAQASWPFYNIVKVDKDKYRVDLAVAGFGKNEIDIELANNTLVVKGSLKSEETEDSPIEYLFKGIADRSFTRSFTLADHVEVKNAELVNGVLRIWLDHLIPLGKQSKKINIE